MVLCDLYTELSEKQSYNKNTTFGFTHLFTGLYERNTYNFLLVN